MTLSLKSIVLIGSVCGAATLAAYATGSSNMSGKSSSTMTDPQFSAPGYVFVKTDGQHPGNAYGLEVKHNQPKVKHESQHTVKPPVIHTVPELSSNGAPVALALLLGLLLMGIEKRHRSYL